MCRKGWGKQRLNFGIVRPEDMVSAEAKAIASHADAVVVAVGFDQSIEGEAGDRMFVLPPGQDDLINQIAAINKNTVVVVTSGGGVDMNAWVDHVPGIFEAWYPGAGRRHRPGPTAVRRFQPVGQVAHDFRPSLGRESNA